MKKSLSSICLLVAAASSALRAADWTITTSTFETRQISLTAIDGKTISGKSADESAYSLPLDQFIEASRAVRIEKIKSLVLFTSTGDRLVGKPARIDGSNLVWLTTGIGEIAIPIDQALGVAKGVIGDELLSAAHSEDEILLTNGDTVKGIVTAVTDKTISITPTGAQSVDVPVDSIKQLFFTTPPQGRTRSKAGGYVLHLTSGAIISCQNISINDPAIEIQLTGGASTKIDRQQIAMIEHLGSSLNWLSSRKPEKVEYVPYFSGNFQPQMDHTVTGDPIQFGDTTYHRGIGMHSKTRMTWKIEDGDKQFRARFFIDPSLGYADVDVRVYVDDKKIHETTGFKAGAISPVVNADLSGAKSLTLEVDYGKGYDIQDRVNWVEAAILK